MKRIQAEFGIARLTTVDDHVMLSQTLIDEQKEILGLDLDSEVEWLTTLKISAIRRLVVDD